MTSEKETSMSPSSRFPVFPRRPSCRPAASRIFPVLRIAILVALLAGTAAGCSKEGNSEDGAAGATGSVDASGPASGEVTSERSEVETAGAPTGDAPGETPSNGSGYVEPPRNIRVLTLERAELPEHLVLSGVLRPTRGADISAEEPGVIAQILRDKGAYVKRGEPILALDRRILEAEKKSAEANETLNKFNEERTEALFEENSVSGHEMLLVHTQAAQAGAQADIARLRYERAAFPSPFPGIVSERFVEIGELVAPGTRVARIIDPYRLELVGSITEREVAYVNKGASVEIALEGQGTQVRGEVSWVGFEADPLTGKFPVEITVDNQDLELRPGLLGRARIEKQAHADVLAIPRDAILSTSDGPTVYVAEGERARRRKVSLGADQGSLVEVRSGLDPGDELIVRGHRDLADGTPVKIQERATRRDGSIESDPSVVHEGSTVEPLGREISGGTR